MVIEMTFVGNANYEKKLREDSAKLLGPKFLGDQYTLQLGPLLNNGGCWSFGDNCPASPWFTFSGANRSDPRPQFLCPIDCIVVPIPCEK
jgi:hypothetical protein